MSDEVAHGDLQVSHGIHRLQSMEAIDQWARLSLNPPVEDVGKVCAQFGPEGTSFWLLTGAYPATWRELGPKREVTATLSTETLHNLMIEDEYLKFTSAAPVTVKIYQSPSQVNLPLGQAVLIEQGGTGRVTVSPIAGVTLNTALSLSTRARYSVIALVQVEPNVWTISGDLL
jgi:hypothetical protein